MPSATTLAAWSNRGSYVNIEGFDINGQSGSQWKQGILERGSINIIKNNHIHHIADKVACDSNGGSAINTSNQDNGVNIDVIGNVVHHMGFAGCNHIHGIYMATSGNVKNNIVYQVGAVAIHLWHDAAKINIVNNTVFGSTTAILVGGGDFYKSTTGADYVNVHNNIAFDNSSYGIREYGKLGPNNTYTNNLSYNNGSNWYLLNGKQHTGDVNADPQFMSYSRTGGGDYRLKATSPAIDKGVKTYAPPADINGVVRPQGAGVDIGAYEHTGS